MKKTQKICIFYFVLGICMFVLVLIFLFEKKHTLAVFYPSTREAMYDMSREKIEEEIGIKEEWILQEHVLSSMLLISSQRIFMFECKEKEKIKQTLFLYIEKLKEEFSNSDELTNIENYVIYEKEDYYILIISEDANKIVEEIRERI